MLKRVWVFIMAAVTLMCMMPVNVRAESVASGEWVLVKTEDQEAEDYTSPDDPDYSVTVDYTYARGAYSLDWQAQWTDSNNVYNSSGSISAKFTGLPERIKPGQTVTINAELYATSTTNTPEKSHLTTNYPVYATIYLPGFAENIDSYTNEYIIWNESFDTTYEDTKTVSFTLPEGFTDCSAQSVEFQFYNTGAYPGFPADYAIMSTCYTYEWVPGQATATPAATQTAAQSIRLNGLVRSVENKPMPWFKLQAYVYYGTDKYDDTKYPDTVIDGATDYKGRYSMEVPIDSEQTGPVGVLLVGTMNCVYPYEAGKDLFCFVDMSDSFSKTNNQISVSTWLTVDPATQSKPDNPQDPISVYRLLAFYNLGLGAWSFDDELMPDPVIYFSSDPDEPQLLQEYSMLYTTAYDAWFFGAGVLKEEKALTDKTLRIEVRWPPSGNNTVSYFSANDHTIHLTALDSKRDDNSRFTILHEFGHFFDAITNSGAFRASAGMGANDTNHGGYLNDSTSDSYCEAFATCYGALTQRFMLYKNPGVLDWITLTDPCAYKAWGSNGEAEELAIASLLYYALPLTGSIEQYWSLLKPDRMNFYEYYQAIEQYLAGQSAAQAQKLSDYAFAAGLYQMPFGNNKYDAGEPFRDIPDPATNKGNGTYDAGEPYGDLMFDVDSNGEIDTNKPLQSYDRQKITVGAVSDAQHTRQTLYKPENSYLYLSGEISEYLLVTVRPNGGEATRSLRAVNGNRVFIGLPDASLSGTLEVSVPGGGVVYTGDLAQLQQSIRETAGQAVPLAQAAIAASDLPASGTQALATYGDANAAGVMTVPELSRDELVKEADLYDPAATMDEIKADLTDSSAQAGSDGGGSSLSLILIIGGSLLGVGAIVGILLVMRKRRSAPESVCRLCGKPIREGSTVCEQCSRSSDEPKFCIFCGAKMEREDVFCDQCGRMND